MEERSSAQATVGPLASVGRRAAAVIIDGLVALPVLVVAAIRYGTPTHEVWTSNTGKVVENYHWTLEGPAFWLFLAAWLVYYVAMEAAFKGTLGKMAVGVRIAAADGSPVGIRAVLIRNGLRIVDGLLFYLVGAVAAWNSPLRQRLGDRVAGTVVVSRSS